MKKTLLALSVMVLSVSNHVAAENDPLFDFIKPFAIEPLTESVEASGTKHGIAIYTRAMRYLQSATLTEDFAFTTPSFEISGTAGMQLWGVVVKPVETDRPSIDFMINDGPEIAALREQGYGRNSEEVKAVRAARFKAFQEYIDSDKMHQISPDTLAQASWAYCGELEVTFTESGDSERSRVCLQDTDEDGAFDSAYFITALPDPQIAADSGINLDPKGLAARYTESGRMDMGLFAVAMIQKRGKSYSLLFGMIDEIGKKNKVKKKNFRLFPGQRHALSLSTPDTKTVYGDAVQVALAKKKRLDIAVAPTDQEVMFARSFGPLMVAD